MNWSSSTRTIISRERSYLETESPRTAQWRILYTIWKMLWMHKPSLLSVFTVSVPESDLLSCRDTIDLNSFERVGTILVTSRLKYELERHLGFHRCLKPESHLLLRHMMNPCRFAIWHFDVFVGKRSRTIIIYVLYVSDIDVRLQTFLYQNCSDQLLRIFLDHSVESHHDLHKLLFHIVYDRKYQLSDGAPDELVMIIWLEDARPRSLLDIGMDFFPKTLHLLFIDSSYST